MELQNSREYKGGTRTGTSLKRYGLESQEIRRKHPILSPHLTAGINANHSGGYQNGR